MTYSDYRIFTIYDMSQNKSALFQDQEIALANFAKAMSHPARIRIVQMLLDAPDGLSCRDFVERLPLAQATVSQHLKELTQAEILRPCPCGPSVCYSLDRSKLLIFCRSFQTALGNPPKD